VDAPYEDVAGLAEQGELRSLFQRSDIALKPRKEFDLADTDQRALAALLGRAEVDTGWVAPVTVLGPARAARSGRQALFDTMAVRYPAEQQTLAPWQARAELTRMAQPQPLTSPTEARAELTALAAPPWVPYETAKSVGLHA